VSLDRLNLTPREIVSELDRHIVGQRDAKRAVSIAIRNRWRRSRVEGELHDEITPKNIILIGPTGVGKTEIARRLAQLIRVPFIKVEATSYTQVGYVGRDVETMIRDLVSKSYALVKKEEVERLEGRASESALDRLLELLVPAPTSQPSPEEAARLERTRGRMKTKLEAGELDEREVELELANRGGGAPTGAMGGPGLEQMGVDLQELFGRLGNQGSSRKRLSVRDARRALIQEEAEKLIDDEGIKEEALRRAQEGGIIFIDEIDKVAGNRRGASGPDVSGEGVQRDLLPIVEGTSVQTRLGMVRTDHILFIAAGAFHLSKPSDLIPELQGRFPIRVTLGSLTQSDLRRILTEPRSALTAQYTALLSTEGVHLDFQPEAIDAITRIAFQVNSSTENIGARRLHTVMEKLLEDLLFEAPDRRGATVVIDEARVEATLAPLLEDEDLSRFVL